MFTPFDDYLVHLKLAEARELWARHDRLKGLFDDEGPQREGPRSWRATLKLFIDSLVRGWSGTSDAATEVAVERRT